MLSLIKNGELQFKSNSSLRQCLQIKHVLHCILYQLNERKLWLVDKWQPVSFWETTKNN